MAGIVAMLFGAGINVSRFQWVSNYMFSKLSNRDHGADERKRHNEAIEKLTKRSK